MAEKSSLLRDAVVDLKKLKNEAVEIAKKEVISQAKEQIEENAKRIFESMVFETEESEETEIPSSTGEDTLEIEIDIPSDETSSGEDSTYVDKTDEFNFDDENNNTENIEDDTMENNDNVNMVDSPDMDEIIREFLELAEEDGIEIESGMEDETALDTELEAPIDEIGAEEGAIEQFELEEDEFSVEDNEFSEEEEEGTVGTVFTYDDDDDDMSLSEEEDAELDALELELQEELNRLNEELADLDSEEEEDEVIDGLESEDEEVLPEGEECEEGEEPIEEASMSSDANLKHKNAKPANREANARKVNLDEAKDMYNKLATEVTKILNENKTYKVQVDELKSVNESLTSKLKEFKDKLYEASVITSKTAFVNRLFLEHTTTQEQKKSIVSAFNKANTRDEVKSLYESYNNTFGATVLNEGFESKISKVVTEGTSQQATNIVHGVDVSRYKKMINYKSK
jgi:hypothetical protein